MTIALHTFVHGPGGSRCAKCDRRWAWVMSAQTEDIGQEGYACWGKLTTAEYAEIRAERERVWLAVAETGGA